MMLPSPFLFYLLLAIAAGALVWRCWSVDRVLAVVVCAALVVNLGGAAAMGWWTQRVHGRAYTAGDEVGYQWEGERLLRSWRTGRPLVRATVGAYAPINAVVIALAGPGQTPVRMLTGLVGAAGVAAVYWLAMLMFRARLTARVAAVLAAMSPLLILYSWANLRDRWIGVAVVLVLIAIVRFTDRWSWPRLLAVAASLVVLGGLRHYWAALLGWLLVAMYAFVAEGPWKTRIVRLPAVVLVTGLALWAGTGSFLAYNMRGESVQRYVTVAPGDTGGAAGRSGIAAPAGAASAGGDAAEIYERPPFSGDTLGEAKPAQPPANIGELARNLNFVLFGRVRALPDRGQYASKLLFPEAIGAVALLPLAAAGFCAAFAAGRHVVILPAAYVLAIIAILSWLRGDDWNTYRFRGLYWSVLLVFVAGGITWLYRRWSAGRTAATA
jgi:hypothetical protein